MQEITCGSKTIAYERFDSDASSFIKIRIDSNRSVNVIAPPEVSEGEITRIVKKKSTWILEKLRLIDEVSRVKSRPEFVSGEGIWFKGKTLRLKVKNADSVRDEEVHSDTTTIFCKTTNPKDEKSVEKLVKRWYFSQAKDYLTKRTVYWSNRIGVLPQRVSIRNQTLRWGSCTVKNEILLNWRIIRAPPSVVDYVIIHELAHTKEKRHSKKFWDIVKSVMPQYEAKRDWLRVNGPAVAMY